MRDTLMADLVTAYRKAKVDLYYSSDPRLIDLVEYEEALTYNLGSLFERLCDDDETWVTEPSFVGSFTLAPERIDFPRPETGHAFHWSTPSREWEQRVSVAGRDLPVARFRVMARCSIDMHVLATLWMLTVGERFESRLEPTAMGSRLKRNRSGEHNLIAPGSFKHYLAPYARWRDGGLKVMSSELSRGNTVIAMTADVSSFYHKLDPRFLLDIEYQKEVLRIKLSSWHAKVNRLFVSALGSWNRNAMLEVGSAGNGIPVGLPASAIVANLALIELDRIAAREFDALYYGRYVDDIILVLRGRSELTSETAVWAWLIERSRGLLRDAAQAAFDSEGGVAVQFSPAYLAGSEIVFKNEKNKVFHLSGTAGEALIESIKSTINERASEWRSLGEVNADPKKVETDIAVATRADGEASETLRDTDRISSRRSAFAIRLREFEAYERDLDLDSWSAQRKSFFNTVCTHILVLPTFFELSSYVPRIVKLAAACGDHEALRNLFEALSRVFMATGKSCSFSIKGYEGESMGASGISRIWSGHMVREALENLASGLADHVSAANLERIVEPLKLLDSSSNLGLFKVRYISELHRRLFVHDLAHVPYRFLLLNHEFAPVRGIPAGGRKLDELIDALPLDRRVASGLDLLTDSLRVDLSQRRPGFVLGAGSQVAGLKFATRPPNIWELFLALRGGAGTDFGFADSAVIQKIMFAVRGYVRKDQLPEIANDSDGYPVLSINAKTDGGKVRFALAMLHTEESSWKAAAIGAPDLSRARYESLKAVLNEATARSAKPHYLLLPESALPSRWFIPFADRLQRHGVNLIAGVEYLQGSRKGIVHNQVWAALRSDGSTGLGHVVYPQDKQKPAPGEERNLHDLACLQVQPKVRWTPRVSGPPVIAHGEFRFALLVCSELTNIQYRTALRGRVDAIIVPEWNQDLHTFEALVESAALDVHAYIVQSNHRTYGDSRIRAPRAIDWQRDIVRVRGGKHDYVVVGEIDYWSLREHQSAHRVHGGDFKPVPDGFVVATDRKRLPKMTGK